MKTKILFSMLLVLWSVNRAEAADVAVIVSPPGILNILILLFACTGVVVGYQILSVVRGGRLSRSWQLFVAGFAVLVLTQIVSLGQYMAVLNLPGWVVPALLVLMSGVFAYGIIEARRVLG